MQKTAKTIILFSLLLIFLMGCVQAEGIMGLDSHSQEVVDSPKWVKDLPQAQNESVNQF